jgi:hypothetical protein
MSFLSISCYGPIEALIRMAEAEDTLRAIGAGEVFAGTTADRPYRMFIENMRDGAATLPGRPRTAR